MSFYRGSLRSRIFLSMILLVIGASILIAVVTIFQYREEAEDYHGERLLRKESTIRKNIDYVIKTTTYPVETEKIPLIFKDRIYEIKDIHNLEIYLYDLQGHLLKTSKASFVKDTIKNSISPKVLEGLKKSDIKSFVEQFEENGIGYRSSFTYITDRHFKPLAILNLPYIEDDDFINKELKENLIRLGYAYLFMLLIAIILAYFLSKYITKSLNTISEKITETRLNKHNQKIIIDDTSEEITTLVSAYNGMIDELEISAAQLASNEREAAWREMAKQVAHEIKNPLTPMRLTVQSFQRKFDVNDVDIHKKMKEYSDTLIQQIDTMSSIASAFSTYAQMPAQQDETLNVVNIIKLALDIFNEGYINFYSEEKEIIANFDRTQLIRVITNLIKNSIQAISEGQPEDPKIEVRVFSEKENVSITVMDNGIGVESENVDKIFEPKFTTKTSGMGLGLAMVKKIVETYGGTISLNTAYEIGTTFKVTFPK
ncbi:MAG: two-component system nitrogen regulation sensor histidine kinase NtrY [Flavobacteriaceae bacterium]|jgi:two-component system nitrogen regulation sensor histidine kinase NtrY|uniref:sensor histidine kinase n=1 Tax=Candidatus Marifrigoribacter sp. Uisw_064 TaxID=3230970 RepID=UPI003AE540F1